MDRSCAPRVTKCFVVAMLLVGATLLSAGGCAQLIATGLYVFDGGNLAPAECDALQGQRVVVVCRPPASNEFTSPGASNAIAEAVSKKLVANVKGIDVVNPREVDNWIDVNDWEDFRELDKAVKAEKLVNIEIGRFELNKRKKLYQVNADVTLSVQDVKKHNRTEWEKHLGEILYPVNSGIPAQDKPPQQFEREFVEIVAENIAINFYRHDPHGSFAMDALA